VHAREAPSASRCGHFHAAAMHVQACILHAQITYCIEPLACLRLANKTSPLDLALAGISALGLTRMLSCACAPNSQEGGEAGDQAMLRAVVEGLPHLTHLTLVARTSEVCGALHDRIALRCTEVSAGRAHPGHTLFRAAESAAAGQARAPANGRSP